MPRAARSALQRVALVFAPIHLDQALVRGDDQPSSAAVSRQRAERGGERAESDVGVGDAALRQVGAAFIEQRHVAAALQPAALFHAVGAWRRGRARVTARTGRNTASEFGRAMPPAAAMPCSAATLARAAAAAIFWRRSRIVEQRCDVRGKAGRLARLRPAARSVRRRTISGTPPLRPATTGRPAACASRIAMPVRLVDRRPDEQVCGRAEICGSSSVARGPASGARAERGQRRLDLGARRPVADHEQPPADAAASAASASPSTR